MKNGKADPKRAKRAKGGKKKRAFRYADAVERARQLAIDATKGRVKPGPKPSPVKNPVEGEGDYEQVTLYLPAGLLAQVEDYRRPQFMKRSEALRRLLAAGLRAAQASAKKAAETAGGAP